MALINPEWTDHHGTTHEEAYVCISKIDLDIFRRTAKITIQHYHDATSKDQKYNPILVETKSYGGEDYDNIFIEVEENILSNFYNILTDGERRDNADFQDMEAVYEKMIKEHDGGEHAISYIIGEEISRDKAVNAALIEDVDFEIVNDMD